MSLNRIPLFCWAILTTSILLAFATPSLTVALSMLLMDRNFGSTFFDFARGGGQLGRLIAFFIYATGEETFGEDLAVLAGLVADGRLRVEKGVQRDWGETPAAVQALRDRRVTGKVVLTVG
jgi:NADPH:quinone reductase-like Zn-dependent oxidoreductase